MFINEQTILGNKLGLVEYNSYCNSTDLLTGTSYSELYKQAQEKYLPYYVLVKIEEIKENSIEKIEVNYDASQFLKSCQIEPFSLPQRDPLTHALITKVTFIAFSCFDFELLKVGREPSKKHFSATTEEPFFKDLSIDFQKKIDTYTTQLLSAICGFETTETSKKSQYNVGIAYETGFGLPKNDLESAKWVWCAANNGVSEAQLKIGFKYFKLYSSLIKEEPSNISQAFHFKKIALSYLRKIPKESGSHTLANTCIIQLQKPRLTKPD